MDMVFYLVLAIVLGLIFMVFYGHYNFYSSVEKEKDVLFNLYQKKENLIERKDLDSLPPIMRTYLEKVGVIGMCKDCNVVFKQLGKIKTGPSKKWTSFMATQYMTSKHPGFIWSAKVFPLFVRDKSINGKAEMKVSLFGIKKVVLATGLKIDLSALGRCLGELIFYPIAFLSENISWEEIDGKSVKANVTIANIKIEGIFHFNEEGLIVSYEAQRYRDEELEYFTGLVDNYKVMEGLYIPSSMSAIWNLKSGDFEFFKCDIHNYKID